MKCPKCGFEDIKETDTICRGCGESVYNMKNNKVVIEKADKEAIHQIDKQTLKENEQEEIETLNLNDNIQDNNKIPPVDEENHNKTCEKCGNIINDGEEYCQNCKPSEEKIQKKTKKGKISILVILAILALSIPINSLLMIFLHNIYSPIFMVLFDITIIIFYIHLKNKEKKDKETSEISEPLLNTIFIIMSVLFIGGFAFLYYFITTFFSGCGSFG